MSRISFILSRKFAVLLLLMGAVWLVSSFAHAAQIDICDPDGDSFGSKVAALPNGNFVVLDPGGLGAVHMYSPQGERIITLRDATTGDLQSAQIFVLHSGNFLILARAWNDGPNADTGAVTRINS